MRRSAFFLLVFLLLLLSFFPHNVVAMLALQDGGSDPTLTLRPNADGQYSTWSEWQATDIFADQFESGDFSAWDSGGTGAIVTTPIHHGTYASEFDIGESQIKTITAGSPRYVRAYIRWTNPPTSGNAANPLVIRQGGIGTFRAEAAVYNDAGTIKWRLAARKSDATTETVTFSTPNPTPDTWYCVEIRWVKNTVGGASLYIDGTLLGSITGTTYNSDIGDFIISGLPNTPTGTKAYFDCIVVSNSRIDQNGNPFEHWERTSDQSDNTGLKVVTSTTLKEALNLEDTSQTGTINSITAYVRCKASGSDPAEQAVILWRTYSTDYESSAITISRTAFTDYSEQRNTNPNTGSAWTWTEVNALQIGARASTLASGETISVSEFWIEAAYTTGAIYNFYGSINSQLSIGTSRTWTFDRFSSLNSTLSVASEKTWTIDKDSSISGQFTINLERTWLFNRFSSLNPQLTITFQKAVSFNIFSTINPSFSITGFAEFIYGQILNLFGSIGQVVSIITTKTVSFSLYSTINSLFTITGVFSLISKILYFFGSIGALLGIIGWTSLAPPAVAVVTRLWILGFIFGGVGFVFGIFALIYMKNKRDKEEKGEELYIYEGEEYTEED